MVAVSVVVPCYNQGGFLAQCLDSIVAQAGVELDIVVVDDGSTDQTAKVVAHAQAADARIRYFHKKNGGLSSARNLGLLVATGEYVKLLDSDDVLAPGSLALQAAYLSAHPECDVAYGVSQYFNDGEFGVFRSTFLPDAGSPNWISELGESAEPWILKFLGRNMMPVCSPLFRRSLIERVGLFDMRLRSMEDWDFWLRAVLARCSFDFVREFGTVAYIRTHRASLTVNASNMSRSEYAMRCNIHPGLPDRESRAVNAAMLLDLARRLELAGDPAGYAHARAVLTGFREKWLLRFNMALNRCLGGAPGRLLRSWLPWRIRHSLAQAGLHF